MSAGSENLFPTREAETFNYQDYAGDRILDEFTPESVDIFYSTPPRAQGDFPIYLIIKG